MSDTSFLPTYEDMDLEFQGLKGDTQKLSDHFKRMISMQQDLAAEQAILNHKLLFLSFIEAEIYFEGKLNNSIIMTRVIRDEGPFEVIHVHGLKYNKEEMICTAHVSRWYFEVDKEGKTIVEVETDAFMNPLDLYNMLEGPLKEGETCPNIHLPIGQLDLCMSVFKSVVATRLSSFMGSENLFASTDALEAFETHIPNPLPHESDK